MARIICVFFAPAFCPMRPLASFATKPHAWGFVLLIYKKKTKRTNTGF